MVAEKASIARSIAEAIAGKGKYVPRKGLTNICPIMSWEGEFKGKKAEFHVNLIHTLSLHLWLAISSIVISRNNTRIGGKWILSSYLIAQL